MDTSELIQQKIAQKTAKRAQKAVQQKPSSQPSQHIDTFPEAAAARTVGFVRQGENADTLAALPELLKQVEGLKAGDLSQIEAMLFSQATATQAIFNHLASFSSVLLQGPTANAKSAEKAIALMQLALKAQNQSRQTLTALAEIKNPKRAVFVKKQLNLLQLEKAKVEQQLKAIEESEAIQFEMETQHETLDT
jgi:hypothetical protein